MTPSATRIFCIVARGASVAVVFRRGPSRQVQLLRWDMRRDTFVSGQWLKGRLYERRCDLSPSGEYLIYFAAKHGTPLGTWTAISRPPFLTALALWPKGDAWGGGGLFKTETVIELNHREDETSMTAGFSLAKGMEIRSFGDGAGCGEDFPIYERRLARDGWQLVEEGAWRRGSVQSKLWIEYQPPRCWVRVDSRRQIVLTMELHGVHQKQGPGYLLNYRFSKGADHEELGECDWADLGDGGDLLYAQDGRLYRRPFGEDTARELIDLRPHRFEELAPTAEARQW